MESTSFLKAEIIRITCLNEYVKLFLLKPSEAFPYLSGQFIIIDFESINHTYSTRSYSISDWRNDHLIEICVVLKLEGAATPLLFSKKEGDLLKISIAQGRFVLPEPITENPICFICTGTGVAPFRTMIKDLLINKKFKSNIDLFFGGRNQADLLFKEEFETLSETYPNFHYYPSLSREKWDYLQGYVHEHYLTHYKHKPEALFYICGWTKMVKEARDHLKELGYTRKEIKIELYD
jgi:CDP-4-dehydro-6-deoxyglucose reductase